MTISVPGQIWNAVRYTIGNVVRTELKSTAALRRERHAKTQLYVLIRDAFNDGGPDGTEELSP